MNTLHTRIIKVFEQSKLSQSDFARKINVTPAYVWKLLNKEDSIPSDRVIADICEKFFINEEWLRYGTGGIENMFIPEDMLYIYNVGKLGNEQNEFKKFYLNLMMGLPDDYWNYIYEEFKKFDKTHEHP